MANLRPVTAISLIKDDRAIHPRINRPLLTFLLLALCSAISLQGATIQSRIGYVSLSQAPAKNVDATFPVTPVGQTTTLCKSLCFCNGPCPGNVCDGTGSGTVQINHALALPFRAYGYTIAPYGLSCSSGTPVNLPAFVGVGQQLNFILSFSPTRQGSFSDYLDLSGLIFNASGSTPSGFPDIVPFRPTGWSDAIVVTNTLGSHVDTSPLASSPLYVSWAIQNDGSASTDTTFYPALYLDNVFLQSWRGDPPFRAGNFGYVVDYPFGPLNPGSHTLRLSPDSTNILGPSHDYTKTFTVGQTSAKLRLVAKSMNLLDSQAKVIRTQKVDLNSAPQTLTFTIGEGFILQAIQINGDGSDGPAVSITTAVVNQASAPPPVSTSLEKSPTVLFPNKVVLSFSGEPQNFVPVHSGTATISIATSSGNATISLQVSPSGKLGVTDAQGHDLDDPVLRYADLRGIPPQIVKAVIETESTFSTKAYRYEPLTIDFFQLSTRYCETIHKCNVDDLRILSQYRPYTVQTFADSTDGALSQGSGLVPSELAIRERYFVTLDSKGTPLKALLSPPSRSDSKRKILSSDVPASMENILYTSNTTAAVPGGWYSTANPSREPEFRAYRAKNAHLPFTAQTVLAASYGLMQATITTAVSSGYTTGGISRQPSGLFDKSTNLDLGTEILAAKCSASGIPDQFTSVGTFREAWRKALVRYNGGALYGPKVLTKSTTYFPIH